MHGGPEFIPWHREMVNRLEEMLRQINPQLSLHYWDWTQDPRSIPNANMGGGITGNLNLFTPDFMGYGGIFSLSIGTPWQNAIGPWLSDGFYLPGASPERSAKLWMQIVTELKNRGVSDIFIACVDGLKGFPEAIEAVYPQTQVQLCMAHMVRHALSYVSHQDRKAIATDRKMIYQATTLDEAERQITQFEET